jgi:hypothetical protein
VKIHRKLLEIFCVVTRQQTPEVVESHQLTPVFFVFSLIVSISAACHGNPYCFATANCSWYDISRTNPAHHVDANPGSGNNSRLQTMKMSKHKP